MDLLELLRVDREGSSLKSWLYRAQHHRRYRLSIFSVITAHLALAFWEAPVRPFSASGDFIIHAVGMTLVLLELLDACLWLWLCGTTYDSLEPTGDILVRPATGRTLYLTLITITLLDGILQAKGHEGGIHMLGWTAALRPLLLPLRFRIFRDVVKRFCSTVVRAGDVLGFLMLVALICSGECGVDNA
jgi:hypothetical protein